MANMQEGTPDTPPVSEPPSPIINDLDERQRRYDEIQANENTRISNLNPQDDGCGDHTLEDSLFNSSVFSPSPRPEVEPYRGFARCILVIFQKYRIFHPILAIPL
jgi:hypothetical protein